jgi:hypothetical protein
MGTVQKARSWMKYKRALEFYVERGASSWPGQHTWLQVILFKPLLIFGFRLSTDETLFRWLLLERARLHATHPQLRKPVWYVARNSAELQRRRKFLQHLDIQVVATKDFTDIYENVSWQR